MKKIMILMTLLMSLGCAKEYKVNENAVFCTANKKDFIIYKDKKDITEEDKKLYNIEALEEIRKFFTTSAGEAIIVVKEDLPHTLVIRSS